MYPMPMSVLLWMGWMGTIRTRWVLEIANSSPRFHPSWLLPWWTWFILEGYKPYLNWNDFSIPHTLTTYCTPVNQVRQVFYSLQPMLGVETQRIAKEKELQYDRISFPPSTPYGVSLERSYR